jgi:hypothetical protein
MDAWLVHRAKNFVLDVVEVDFGTAHIQKELLPDVVAEQFCGVIANTGCRVDP